MDNHKVKEYIEFQISRSVVSLYKKYFELIEDLHQDHKKLLKKVENRTSSEFTENIDYFDENKYNYIRKKILDSGNDAIRSIESSFKSIEIKIK
ncbi:hypothetical protein OAE97_00165 [Verrucomicrobia bacterium]|jgi:hypothetical protein|nr:hypothetical protein [Verrucomicrobiota bacterium]